MVRSFLREYRKTKLKAKPYISTSHPTTSFLFLFYFFGFRGVLRHPPFNAKCSICAKCAKCDTYTIFNFFLILIHENVLEVATYQKKKTVCRRVLSLEPSNKRLIVRFHYFPVVLTSILHCNMLLNRHTAVQYTLIFCVFPCSYNLL